MMSDMLAADSDVYRDKSGVYHEFREAEDAPRLVSEFLTPWIAGKTVLDFGCGTGNMMRRLAPNTRAYFAADVSPNQLQFARRAARGLPNAKVLLAEPETLPLPDESVDVVVAAWVVGSIHDLPARAAAVNEMKRVLRPSGAVFLVENGTGGEYRQLVNGNGGDEWTRRKMDWLRRRSFRVVQRLATHFQFDSARHARLVFGGIFGRRTARLIRHATIGHNVIVLCGGR